jgi:UDP-N-acetyl-D-galactosamine dehydrogenase
LSSSDEIQKAYNITVSNNESLMQTAQAVILAVPHKYFLEKNWEYISNLLNKKTGVVIDVKGKLDRNQIPENITLWRL